MTVSGSGAVSRLFSCAGLALITLSATSNLVLEYRRSVELGYIQNGAGGSNSFLSRSSYVVEHMDDHWHDKLQRKEQDRQDEIKIAEYRANLAKSSSSSSSSSTTTTDQAAAQEAPESGSALGAVAKPDAAAAVKTAKKSNSNSNNNKNGNSNLQQHDSSSSLPTIPPLAVFYHIHVGDADSERKLTKRQLPQIIQEQVDLVRQSFAASIEAAAGAAGTTTGTVARPPLTIYFNTMGATKASRLIETYMAQEWCNPAKFNSNNSSSTSSHQRVVKCQHGEHYQDDMTSTLYEQGTLQSVYDYCQHHVDHTVVYLHNKGALNKQKSNEKWRQHMTQAAVSRECIATPFMRRQEQQQQEEEDKDTCNACGLLFVPVPFPHQPGNMWTAQCRYIQKLIPPSQYVERMTNVMRNHIVPMVQDRRELTATLYGYIDDTILGLNPMTSLWESWIGSHPSFRPCSVSQSASIKDWKYDEHNVESEFQAAPLWKRWETLEDGHWYKMDRIKTRQILQSDQETVVREFFFLTGLLLKWQALYPGVDPAPWVWNFYPAGDYWKKQYSAQSSVAAKLTQLQKQQ